MLILVSLKPRRIEVETGYGVEGVLSDATVSKLIREHAVPQLKADHHGAGLIALVNALGTELRRPDNGDLGQNNVTSDVFWLGLKIAPVFFFALFLLVVIGSGNLAFATFLHISSIGAAAVVVESFNPTLKTLLWWLGMLSVAPTTLLYYVWNNRCRDCGRSLGRKQLVTSTPCTATHDGVQTVMRECPNGHRRTLYDVPLARIDSQQCPACGKDWPGKAVSRREEPTYSKPASRNGRGCPSCSFVVTSM